MYNFLNICFLIVSHSLTHSLTNTATTTPSLYLNALFINQVLNYTFSICYENIEVLFSYEGPSIQHSCAIEIITPASEKTKQAKTNKNKKKKPKGNENIHKVQSLRDLAMKKHYNLHLCMYVDFHFSLYSFSSIICPFVCKKTNIYEGKLQIAWKCQNQTHLGLYI